MTSPRRSLRPASCQPVAECVPNQGDVIWQVHPFKNASLIDADPLLADAEIVRDRSGSDPIPHERRHGRPLSAP